MYQLAPQPCTLLVWLAHVCGLLIAACDPMACPVDAYRQCAVDTQLFGRYINGGTATCTSLETTRKQTNNINFDDFSPLSQLLATAHTPRDGLYVGTRAYRSRIFACNPMLLPDARLQD